MSHLAAELTARILTDRVIPETKYNIDHLVVASSGVWIIDAKNWSGKVEYKAKSPLSGEYRLFVNGRDRTSEVEGIYNQIIPVAQLIGDRSIPLRAAMVFIDNDWSLAAYPRLLANKPFEHLGVLITPARPIAKLINRKGALDEEAIRQLAQKLDRALKPA